MADDKKPGANKTPLKAGAVVGLVFALVGAVILDLDWPAYFALLGIVAVVGGIVIAVRLRDGGADSTP